MAQKQKKLFVGLSLYSGTWYAAVDGSDRVGEGDNPESAVQSLIRQLPGDDFPKDPAAYTQTFSPIQVKIDSHQGTLYAAVLNESVMEVGSGTTTEQALGDLLGQLSSKGFPMDADCYQIVY